MTSRSSTERHGDFSSESVVSHLVSWVSSCVVWFCENHARKMRTFFTRRLEPKTRSSYHIKWSNAK